MQKKYIAFLLGAVLFPASLFASDGVFMPLDDAGAGEGAACVTVRLVPIRDDPSIPPRLRPWQVPCDLRFHGGGNTSYPETCGKIVLENRSPWTYRFGMQNLASGYDSLELDFKMESGEDVTLRRRAPTALRDLPDDNALASGRMWQYPVSLDERLWVYPKGFSLEKAVKVRPRFAFGAYDVDGVLYRTEEEISDRKRKARRHDDRDGEVIGEWTEFRDAFTVAAASDSVVRKTDPQGE